MYYNIYVIDSWRIVLKNVWPTDWRKVVEIIGGFVVMGAIVAILWYFIPGLIRWCADAIRWIIEILGYPFWVVFTKFLKIDINQFDAFWAFLGIACLAMVIVGNFTPVRVSQQVTIKNKKEETEG
jgi:TRAP-type C4-dicarboxylate transport system permease small subunit